MFCLMHFERCQPFTTVPDAAAPRYFAGSPPNTLPTSFAFQTRTQRSPWTLLGLFSHGRASLTHGTPSPELSLTSPSCSNLKSPREPHFYTRHPAVPDSTGLVMNQTRKLFCSKSSNSSQCLGKRRQNSAWASGPVVPVSFLSTPATSPADARGHWLSY